MSSKETVGRTFIVASVLCVVCSIMVSFAAVSLKPIQSKNQALDKKKNILAAAGLLKPGVDVEQMFSEMIKIKLVDLSTGEYRTDIDAASYDQRKAAKDPARSVTLKPKEDIARIKRKAMVATVYEVVQDGQLNQVILPVHGKGLWSTMYGFLAVKADTKTVVGLGFYSHAETPGLGGEIDNPKWKALWPGKLLFDSSEKLAIHVLKGKGNPSSPKAIHEIDGLSGATLTTNGVDALLKFWLGPQGFESYLKKIRQRGSLNG